MSPGALLTTTLCRCQRRAWLGTNFARDASSRRKWFLLGSKQWMMSSGQGAVPRAAASFSRQSLQAPHV